MHSWDLSWWLWKTHYERDYASFAVGDDQWLALICHHGFIHQRSSTSEELAGDYSTVIPLVCPWTNTLVCLSIRRYRVTQPGHLCRIHSESFTVTSATFPVIQRPSLSTGKVWLLHTISLIAFSPSPLHYVDNLWRYILCRGHSEVAITHCDRDNQSQQVSSRRGWRRPLVGCPQHAC